MSTKAFDPLRLDVAALAKDGAELSGRWPLAGFERLAGLGAAPAGAAPTGELAWEARGELRDARTGPAQVWLHLRARTSLPLVCQRCLQNVDVAVSVDHAFWFVPGEAAAAQLDADSEDDVLALTRALNLHELIEDEVLLALPLVPRHEVCPQPLPLPPNDPAASDEPADHPFAVLSALKTPGRLN
jgi:uncharacterized protein